MVPPAFPPNTFNGRVHRVQDNCRRVDSFGVVCWIHVGQYLVFAERERSRTGAKPPIDDWLLGWEGEIDRFAPVLIRRVKDRTVRFLPNTMKNMSNDRYMTNDP